MLYCSFVFETAMHVTDVTVTWMGLSSGMGSLKLKRKKIFFELKKKSNISKISNKHIGPGGGWSYAADMQCHSTRRGARRRMNTFSSPLSFLLIPRRPVTQISKE